MPPEAAGSPREWLRVAESDLAISRMYDIDDVMLELLCFHAQQAAEKAVKALLVHFGQDIVRTHSIESLLLRVGEFVSVPAEFENAADLTAYAVAARYPGNYEPVSEDDYAEAISLAERIVAWARALIVA